MSIEKFKRAVDTGDVLGAILAIGSLEDVNEEYIELGDCTPLKYAVIEQSTSVIEALLNNGADVRRSEELVWKPLRYAVHIGHTEIVKLLIAAGADLQGNSHNNTALHQACRRPNVDVVDALIRAGSDVNVKDDKGYTPLYLAHHNNHAEVAKRLYAAGASDN